MPFISREKISRGLKSDLGCLWNRVAECAATDCRESNRFDVIFYRELQRIPIAIRQNLRLMVLSSSPNRTNCVNDEARRQMISASNFRFARSTPANSAAFSEQFRSSGAMNRAIDSSAAKK